MYHRKIKKNTQNTSNYTFLSRTQNIKYFVNQPTGNGLRGMSVHVVTCGKKTDCFLYVFWHCFSMHALCFFETICHWIIVLHHTTTTITMGIFDWNYTQQEWKWNITLKRSSKSWWNIGIAKNEWNIGTQIRHAINHTL